MGFLRYTLITMPSITASTGAFALSGQSANLRFSSGVVAGHNGGRMQTNTNSLNTGEWPFLNLLKESGSWDLQDGSATAVLLPTSLDANGYLNDTAVVSAHGGIKTILSIPTQTERPGNYCVTWDGTGTVVAGGGGAQLGTATFTGSISGTTLTVSTLTGTIAMGQFITWSGSTGYTIVMAQLTGATGLAGTYTVSAAQTVASIAMTASGGSNSSSGTTNAGKFSCTMSGTTFFFQITAIGSSSNYISNVKIFHVDDAAKIAAGEVFGTKFKQRLVEANFGVIRMLDFQNGNTTNVTTWASRKPVSYAFYSGFEYRSALHCTTGATIASTTKYSATGPAGFALADKAMVHVLFINSFTPTAVTFTNASTSIAMPAHGLSIGARLHFDTSLALPGGFAPATKYYVVSVPDAGHITVSATPGGTAITASGTGSGTHNANPFLTMNISGSGDIDILGEYANWLQGSLYPIGGSFVSLNTLVYDAAMNAWVKYGVGGGGQMSKGIDNGVPPELMLQLCVEVGAHPYFIAPPFAVDPMTDYFPSLAAYCRDNAPAWMIPRYEGPNELWNTFGGFYQTGYAGSKATAYSVADPTHWVAGDWQNWYGKIMSTIGQAVATVYSVSQANVKTQTQYHVICGVQTVGMDVPNRPNWVPRLTSASYLNQTAPAQSPYIKSAASNWVTHVACAQYFAPGLYATSSANGTPNEVDLAIAYDGGDSTAPATYVASILVYPAYGIASDFTLPKLIEYYQGTADFASSHGVTKICGYEGSYSPDYGSNTIINNLRRAGKNVAAMQGYTTTNLNNFMAVTGVTAEFPSNFLIGSNYTWSILDPNIYVTTNPPQWLAFIAFNH